MRQPVIASNIGDSVDRTDHEQVERIAQDAGEDGSGHVETPAAHGHQARSMSMSKFLVLKCFRMVEKSDLDIIERRLANDFQCIKSNGSVLAARHDGKHRIYLRLQACICMRGGPTEA